MSVHYSKLPEIHKFAHQIHKVPISQLLQPPKRGGTESAQRLKRLPAMRETWVRSLGREDTLEKEMATHSSILAWEILWRKESGGLQSMASQRVGHNLVTTPPPPS